MTDEPQVDLTQPLETISIEGIWAENEFENAWFSIEKDSIYNVEHFEYSKYEFRNDSLIVFYDGFKSGELVLKLSMDSLWLLSQPGDTIKLYRR